ncbi:MAG: LptF/LptG family permease [Ghiorsea sp.]
MIPILDRYLFKLWLGPFLGFLFVITGLLLFGRVIKVIQIFGDNPIDWGLLLNMIASIIPYFLTLAVPCAFFFSLLKVLKYLQQNSEVDALFAAGISPMRLMRPMLVLAMIFWAFLTWTAMEWMPTGQKTFISIYHAIKKTAAMPELTPRQFENGFDGFTMYHDGEDENGLMQKFMLEEEDPTLESIYVAKTAKVVRHGQFMVLNMYDGVHLEGKGKSLRSTYFSTFSISTDVGDMGVIKPIYTLSARPSLMNLTELNKAITEQPSFKVTAEWHRRWVLATTILILLLFAFPLASTSKRSGKSHEWIWGIALLLMIYNVQITLHKQVSLGELAWWSIWLGQLSFMIIGAILFMNTVRLGHFELRSLIPISLRHTKKEK